MQRRRRAIINTMRIWALFWKWSSMSAILSDVHM